MTDIFDSIDVEGLQNLINSIEALGESLLKFFSTTFQWVGTPTLVALGIGLGIAIVLRIIGRWYNMDLFLMLINKIWTIFTNTAFNVSFQGTTYRISLYAILLFTTITAIVIKVLASFFD